MFCVCWDCSLAMMLSVVEIPDVNCFNALSPWIRVRMLAPLGRHLVAGKLSWTRGLVFMNPDELPVSTTVAVALILSSDLQDVDASLLAAIEETLSGSLRLSFTTDVPLVYVFWRHALYLLGGPCLDCWWFDLGPCPPRHLRSLLQTCLKVSDPSAVDTLRTVSPTIPWPPDVRPSLNQSVAGPCTQTPCTRVGDGQSVVATALPIDRGVYFLPNFPRWSSCQLT